MICFAIGCSVKSKEMGSSFAMYEGYYFFDAQLKGLKHQNLPNKDSIYFGHLDVKSSQLKLIDGIS